MEITRDFFVLPKGVREGLRARRSKHTASSLKEGYRAQGEGG